MTLPWHRRRKPILTMHVIYKMTPYLSFIMTCDLDNHCHANVKACQCQSDHNSTSYATADLPPMPATRRTGPRRRFFQAGWSTSLENRFARTAFTEMAEEGRVAYMVTWYLNKRTFPTCLTSRTVRLTDDISTWEDQIVAAWEDLFIFQAEALLHWVHPIPPQNTLSSHVGHLILEQEPDEDSAAIVLTTHRVRQPTTFIQQAAHIVPGLIHRNDLLDRAQLHDSEQHLRSLCRIHQGGIPFGIADRRLEPEPITSGLRLDIFLPSAQPPPSWISTTTPSGLQSLVLLGSGEPLPETGGATNSDDEIILMQRSSSGSQHGSGTAEADATNQPDQHPTSEDHSFCFNANAPAFQPGLPVIAAQNEFVQDLHSIWDARAFSWEEEERSTRILTFFTDHRFPHLRCDHGRPVRLFADFTDWERQIHLAWHDLIVPGIPSELQIVHPHPPQLGPDYVACVVLVQAPRADLVSPLITLFEGAHHLYLRGRSAVTVHEHIFLEHIAYSLGLHDHCFGDAATHQCQAWYQGIPLIAGRALPGRTGNGIILQLRTVQHVTVNRSRGVEGVSLLQRQVRLHAPRSIPEIDAADADELNVTDTQMRVIDLIPGAPMAPLPDRVEIAKDGGQKELEAELLAWGHRGKAIIFDDHDKAVCFPPGWQVDEGFNYMFCHSDATDNKGAFLHSCSSALPEIDLLRFLYRCGYQHAVVNYCTEVAPHFYKVNFTDQQVAQLGATPKDKPSAHWPAPQPRCSSKAVPFSFGTSFSTDQLLRTSISHQDLQGFFGSHDGILHKDPCGFEFPEEVLQAINACDPTLCWEDLDRLIIYADGSSAGAGRHLPPLRAAEEGSGDAWAYIVLGERYSPPGLTLLGWNAQLVQYDPEGNHFLGADRIGADIAEKEAMSWAGLWRLSHNSSLPTTFRTDSMTTELQASGHIGNPTGTESHATLRGIFQALESLLPGEALQHCHVPGHCGEPWNELCDFLAKLEIHKSQYFRRPALTMRMWRPALSYLWMILSQQDGLPRFCGEGFHVPPPQLPAPRPDQPLDSSQRPTVAVSYYFSLCTANVNSLSAGPDGHRGKLDYLRKQFIHLGLNVLGVQEARTPSSHTFVDQVIRLTSGSKSTQLGVELWINTAQPYGWCEKAALHFKREHFQVVHKDPRALLVHAVCPHFDAWFLVGHAPHSGVDEETRLAWWDHFTALGARRTSGTQLFVMVDANAAPGGWDGSAVLRRDLKSSPSTPLWRDFLQACHLGLPCTSAIHQGDLETWISPDGATQHCIDYIAVDLDLMEACTFSSIVEDFDLGHAQWDHTATAVQMQWKRSHQALPKPAVRKTKFAPHKITTQKIEDILQGYCTSSWDTNIEAHVEGFNAHILQGLHQSCPQGSDAPKKPYIDDQIWELRKAKLSRRRQLKDIERRLREETRVVVFQRWKKLQHCPQDPISDSSVDSVFFDYGSSLLCYKLHAWSALRADSRQLRLRLRSARQRHIQHCFEHMGPGASASTILHTLRPITGPSNLKLKTTALPYLQKEDGSHCQNPLEAREEWIRFFQQMEGGTRLSLNEQRDQWIASLATLANEHLHVHVSEMPTLLDLERAFRRVQPTKAVGPDGIHPAICHSAPSQMARRCFTQLMKFYLHGQEALTHKGGCLHPIWKGKGPMDICSSFRSILVSSHVGKCLHRAIRQKQCTLFERYLQAEQLGGRPHVPVTLGVHVVRAYLRQQATRGHCVGLVFLDLTEAFYRVLRPLAIGGPIDDDTIIQMAHRLGLSDDILQGLWKHLADPHATALAQLPPQAQHVLRALHSETHFHLRGQEDVCKTKVGTRPGDCFADVVFSYLWARLLHGLQERFREFGLENVIPAHPTFEPFGVPQDDQLTGPTSAFIGPTWMGDLCLCASAEDALSLERKVRLCTSWLLTACRQFAMTPNLKTGKPEIFLSLRGRHSHQIKKKYFGPSASGLMSIIDEDKTHQVRVVSGYQHLGGWVHHKQGNVAEIRKRIAIAHTTFTQHRKTLLQNAGLSLRRRVELFRSLILSRLLYGAESWTIGTQKFKHYLHSAILRLYRRLLPDLRDQHAADDEILCRTGLPSPSELLRACRLRYLCTLFACHDVVPWGLLNADTSWIALVQDDITWMWHQLKGASSLLDPREHFESWRYLLRYHRPFWKRLVRRACGHVCLQRANRFQVLEAHHRILDEFITLGHLSDSIFHEGLDEGLREEAFGCMSCRRAFSSRGGEGAHMFKVHGICNRVRKLFNTTTCPACLKEYFTYGKVKNHLLYSEECRRILIGRGHFVEPVGGWGSTQDGHLAAAHDALLPPLQGEGPQQLAVLGEEVLHDLVLGENIYQALAEREDLQSSHNIEQIIRDAIHARHVSWTSCSATLRYLIEHITIDDAEAIGLAHREFVNVLNYLNNGAAWSFLGHDRRQGPPRAEIEQIHAILEHESTSTGRDFLQVPTPRPFGRHRYVLHAFSGRRRLGDFQYFLDRAGTADDGFVLHTISLDLVVDDCWGDVSRVETRNFWLQGIKEGFVTSLLAGPPCETWSRARGVALPGKRCPRIIRIIEALWGMESLSLRELRQLGVGNLLLLFTIEALVHLAIAGGHGILEHPAMPEDEDRASIWRLPLVNFLLTWPDFRLVSLSQGLWGAASPKPTMLLALNFPDLEKHLLSWQVAKDLPKGASIGMDNSGQWATAKLKEYPPALCGGLSEAFFAVHRAHATSTALGFSHEFHSRCSHMEVTSFGDVIGRDYAGWDSIPCIVIALAASKDPMCQ